MSTIYLPIPNREKAEIAKQINEALRSLCIPGTAKGFQYLAYMLVKIVFDPRQLDLITKNLYPDTGCAFDVSASRVERNARTAISICWRKGGRETLDQMACCHLIERPTVSEFLDIVADYIRRAN